MAVLVQKYGGTSIDGPDRIGAIARRVAGLHRAGHDMIVVVSAMGQTTDEMFALARAVHPDPPERELDMLVTAGERIAMSLLAMAIHREGCEAISFTGSQSGIITSSEHGNARIKAVRAFRIEEALHGRKVVIVAGYQGVSENKEVTTLGRGGSDLTAVALAAAFQPSGCELRKDVDGILTIDPRHAEGGIPIPELPAEAALALSRAGSTVLHDVAVEYAISTSQPLVVCAAHDERVPGTKITMAAPGPDRVYGTAVRTNGEGYQVSLVAGDARARLVAAQSVPGLSRGRYTPPYTVTWPCAEPEDVRIALDRLRRHFFEAGAGAADSAPSP